MANLIETRKKLVIAAYVLGGVAALAALLIVLPVRASYEERANELNAVKLESKKLESEVSPLQGLPDKLVKTRRDIATFHKERFPERFSAVPEQLGSISSKHGVRLSDVKYETFEIDIPGLQEVAMEATLSGDYARLVKFINELERNKVFFLVDQIDLGEANAGAVRLQIKLKTYLRSDRRLNTAQDGKTSAANGDRS
ncbi:MAG TPA: GspMb/PilO family protein [Terriglobales bacterium]|nr:GspMb/PilO family protein [Terriglobales bacterium]